MSGEIARPRLWRGEIFCGGLLRPAQCLVFAAALGAFFEVPLDFGAREDVEASVQHGDPAAEPGEGVAAVRTFMSKSARRHAGFVAARKAMRVTAPVPMSEFYSIVELWADAALQLSEKDLKLMLRLVSAQDRLAKAS